MLIINNQQIDHNQHPASGVLKMKKTTNIKINFPDRTENTENLEWTVHPKFKGVRMKHIIKGDSTEGMISCHIVQVMPHCCLELHVHEDNIEIHEVMEGNGTCLIDGKEICYQSGVAAIIPKGTPHMAKAGENGLLMMARFSPALL